MESMNKILRVHYFVILYHIFRGHASYVHFYVTCYCCIVYHILLFYNTIITLFYEITQYTLATKQYTLATK